MQLWAKLQQGDLDALGKLYDAFSDDLFTYGMQFTPDKAVVMDGIHDVFLNLYKYRKNLAKTDAVDYYLMRSLKNTILKKCQSQLREVPSEIPQTLAHCQASVEQGLIENEIKNERSYKLTRAMSSLSKKQRKSLFLRFTENHSYEEIAEIMQISVASSRTTIYRAIKSLRKQMHLFFTFFL